MRRALAAVSIDVAVLIAFAAIGRRTHAEGFALGGTIAVAAPFLIGYLAAAALLRLDRRPFGVGRGAAVWVVGIVIGLVLRGTVFDRGLAPAFVVVAIVATGMLLVAGGSSRSPRADGRLCGGVRAPRGALDPGA